MKTTTLLSLAAIAAAAFSVTAHAQTGRPSAQETGPAPVAQGAPVDVAQADVGSYARYLMLNGVSRDEAVAAAQNVDHAATSTRFALRTHKAAAVTSAQTQARTQQ